MAEGEARELCEILSRAQSLVRRINNNDPASNCQSSSQTQTTRPPGDQVIANTTANRLISNVGTGPQIVSENEGQQGRSCGNTEVLRNFRRLFAPYNTTGTNTSNRGTGSSGRRRNYQPKQKRETTWTHDFVCLAHKDQLYPPNQREKLLLSDAGHGRKKVVLINNGDAHHVEEKLEEYFPKLKEGGGFEILRSTHPLGSPSSLTDESSLFALSGLLL